MSAVMKRDSFFLCIFEITLQVPCGEQLAEWFEENKITWVTILASVAALQVMCVGIAIYILSRIKRQKKLRYVFLCTTGPKCLLKINY